MSILNFIKRVCVQTAIYWAPESRDGYGGIIYADPVEVKVRWDDIMEKIAKNDGEEIVSSAQIMSPSELEEKGILFLGTMDVIPDQVWIDITGKELSPKDIPKAFEIKKIGSTPLFRSTDKFVKIYYL